MSDALKKFKKYEEVSQLKTIDRMPEDLKKSYIKVVLNMAFDNDGKIDEKEFCEILQLITRIEMDLESRIDVLNYM